ncbi:MAG: hypothetical protein IJS39_06775 [Synergistaceae bacterium]|nr:hypothetical protein [Synergistaceae bacterium]
MTSSDYQTFASFMHIMSLVTIVPHNKNIDELIDALFIMLEDQPLDAVREAVKKHCMTSRYFPMLADIAG